MFSSLLFRSLKFYLFHSSFLFFPCFSGDFQDAISHFILAETDPLSVISIFPDLIPNPLKFLYLSQIGEAMHHLAVSVSKKGISINMLHFSYFPYFLFFFFPFFLFFFFPFFIFVFVCFLFVFRIRL